MIRRGKVLLPDGMCSKERFGVEGHEVQKQHRGPIETRSSPRMLLGAGQEQPQAYAPQVCLTSQSREPASAELGASAMPHAWQSSWYARDVKGFWLLSISSEHPFWSLPEGCLYITYSYER